MDIPLRLMAPKELNGVCVTSGRRIEPLVTSRSARTFPLFPLHTGFISTGASAAKRRLWLVINVHFVFSSIGFTLKQGGKEIYEESGTFIAKFIYIVYI